MCTILFNMGGIVINLNFGDKGVCMDNDGYVITFIASFRIIMISRVKC